MERKSNILARARTRGLAMWRPSLPDLPQIPRLLATRIDITTFSLPSIAASQARRSSSSSALDFAISASLLLLLLVMVCFSSRELPSGFRD
ncbi:hypothetical protein CRG98_023493 [Punica granatum]|uniref:Uncharacterized protein n=1 Tax=Punica granatum TaxID=22663 RepID=A0A2I0JJG9_PUNGR|nr:hypothetical protein CRG98_023493 [Punica granatum]